MANVLDRVRKLLSVSRNNTSVEEASTAAAMAQELMHRHQLHEDDLILPETPPEPVEDDSVLQTETRYETWKGRLMAYLADSMGARLYSWTAKQYVPQYRELNGVKVLSKYKRTAKHDYRIVGLKTSVETIRYMAPYLINEINSLADKGFAENGDGNAKTWKNNFRLGAVQVIGQRLTAQRRAQQKDVVQRRAELEKTGGTNLGLALYQTDQLRQEAFYNKVAKEKRLVSRSTSKAKVQYSAFETGRKAGEKVSLGGGKGLGTAKKEIE